MEEIKKHPYAIVFIALLVLFKFVVVPIQEWQDEQWQDIKLLKKKQDKLVAVEQMAPQLADLQKNNAQALARFNQLWFPKQEIELFKLEKHQWLESVVQAHDLSLENITWGQATLLSELDLYEIKVDIKVKGSTLNTVKLILDLEAQLELIYVDKMILSMSKSSVKSLGKGSLMLSLQLYSRAN